MGRRKRSTSIKIKTDAVYGNILVAKLINKVMYSGKKQLAQRQVYKAFDLVKKKLKKDSLEVFLQAIENIKPRTEVRSRRVGGAAYQVPRLVRGKRRESLAIKWLVVSARGRANKEYHTFGEKLAAEIIGAYRGESGAVARRQEIEKIAEANKAFSHLRW